MSDDHDFATYRTEAAIVDLAVIREQRRRQRPAYERSSPAAAKHWLTVIREQLDQARDTRTPAAQPPDDHEDQRIGGVT